MKFLKSFFASALVAFPIYYAAVLSLIDAPVPAEYWVGEMITIKKELVKKYAGRRKIVIAGGSSTLFGVNAEHASEQLEMPVINFGLHAALRLEKILQEVSTVVGPGDFLILPLEPPYYDCNSKWDSWQVTNIIGWDHNAWRKMSYSEKGEFVSLVSPALLGQMLIAKIQEQCHSTIVSTRLATLNNSLVLSKFRVRTMPATFEYSAYNLNNHGDMLRAEGSNIKGQGYDCSKPNHVCGKTASYLISFVASMKRKGVEVYFANTPYLASGVRLDALRRGESSFRNDLDHIGRIIDRREDLVFDRKFFFNTALHLNAEGRSLRTNLLIEAIRKNLLSGTSVHSIENGGWAE